MQQTHKKNEKELKWFHNSTLFDDYLMLMIQQRIQKSVFKSRIAVIVQVCWHSNILIFE